MMELRSEARMVCLNTERDSPLSDIGDCPLCQASMPIASIPMHIERNCPPPRPVKSDGVANQKSDWKKVFAGVGMAKERQ